MSIDPVAFYILGFGVRWYGIAYLFTFIISLILAKRFCVQTKVIAEKDIDKLLNYVVLGVILGGRIGEFMFYEEKFSAEIFYIWHGGQSFHGGVIGVAMAIILYSFIYKKDMWLIGDIVALYVPIGCFFGRIANYINCELPGKLVKSTFFAEMIEMQRHPVVLYEAFTEGIILFAILNYRKKEKILIRGEIASEFLIYYGFLRFMIEFLREPNGMVWQFSKGQVLSIVMIASGLAIKYILKKRGGVK